MLRNRNLRAQLGVLRSNLLAEVHEGVVRLRRIAVDTGHGVARADVHDVALHVTIDQRIEIRLLLLLVRKPARHVANLELILHQKTLGILRESVQGDVGVEALNVGLKQLGNFHADIVESAVVITEGRILLIHLGSIFRHRGKLLLNNRHLLRVVIIREGKLGAEGRNAFSMNQCKIALEHRQNLVQKLLLLVLFDALKGGVVKLNLERRRMETVDGEGTARREIEERVIVHRLADHVFRICAGNNKGFADVVHSVAGIKTGVLKRL